MRAGIGLIMVVFVMLPGCSSLNSFERQHYEVLKHEGLLVEEKSPVAAAALGLLPGCGSFYTHNWGLGIADFILWPASMLWDPIVAYHQAKWMNYQASRAYLAQMKQREMHDLDTRLAAGMINQVQYLQAKRQLELRFD